MAFRQNENTDERRSFKEIIREGASTIADGAKKAAAAAGIVAGGTGLGAGAGAFGWGIYMAKLGAGIDLFFNGANLQNIIGAAEKGFAIGATVGAEVGAAIGGVSGVALAILYLKDQKRG